MRLAEREGFEPPVPFDITGFQDQRHKPLGHLSIQTSEYNYIRCGGGCQYLRSVFFAETGNLFWEWCSPRGRRRSPTDNAVERELVDSCLAAILSGFCGSLAMLSKGSILKIALSTNAAYGAFYSEADAHSKVRRKAGLAFTAIGRFATAFALALQGRCGGFL